MMARPLPRYFRRWIPRLGLDSFSRVYVYSALVGLFAGAAAVAFTCALHLVSYLCVNRLAGFEQPQPADSVGLPDFGWLDGVPHLPGVWPLLLVPAAGGLLSGYLTWRFAPEAQGSGADAAIDAFHRGRGRIRPVVPWVRAAATVATLGSGGSAGKQGPMVHVGAGLGSWLADRLHLPAAHRRILLLAGAAGALAAVFRAPLGGAVTSVEMLYRGDFEGDALIPSVISSIVSYTLFMAVCGASHVFAMEDLFFRDIRELGAYAVLGLVCALAGLVYMRVFYGLRDRFFHRLPLPRPALTGLGGLLVGLSALVDPRVLGTGFGVLQQALDGELTVTILLVLALIKIFASSCTIASGGSGGFFGPSLFIGGMLGGAVGTLGHQYFPAVVHQPAAYVVVGMAGFFGAVANTPLAALVIITEMTDSYALLPPLMLVGAITFILMRHVSIFEKQVPSKFDSPAHLRNLIVDVLKSLRVADAPALVRTDGDAVLRNDMSYLTLLDRYRHSGSDPFIVVTRNGVLRGMLSVGDLDLPADESLANLILVDDLPVTPLAPIREDDDLHEVLRKLLESGYDKLPVARRGEEGDEMIGYVTHQDLLQAHQDRITHTGSQHLPRE